MIFNLFFDELEKLFLGGDTYDVQSLIRPSKKFVLGRDKFIIFNLILYKMEKSL